MIQNAIEKNKKSYKLVIPFDYIDNFKKLIIL